MDIKYDKYSLIIDGKRTFIRSGAIHYFRSPGEEITKDRFQKLKAAGYNTVDIYFCASYHCAKESEYDFSGIKDVRKVLQIAKDTGLFIIARPGPYINAEVSGGGLPYWLLGKKDVIPRCRIGTEYQYSPEYMAFVKDWYDQIIPIINEFDNVIAFQIENEYANDDMNDEYMRELYQMARDRGITCPIFHNDAFNAGLWADVVDIYADDIYPYISPNQNWKEDHFCLDSLDNLEDMVRSVKEDAPMFIAEMQGGWFDKWDGIGYKAMREALGDENINVVTKTAVSQGVTMFNHFMTIGGTSWGNLACDEIYTSYEFTAGIDEFGTIHPNFLKAKSINYFLNSFGLEQTEKIESLELGENVYAVKRQDLENNCNWLFVRNMNPTGTSISIYDLPFAIHPYDMKIIPENLQLNACKINYSTSEIFARLKNKTREVIFMIADKDTVISVEVQGQNKIISGDKKDYENVKFEQDGKITEFVFISKELSDKTWILGDKVIFNADFVYPNNRIAISKTTEIAYYDLENGFSKKYFKYQQTPQELELADIDVKFCANPIDIDFNYSSWKKIEEPFDSLSIGMHDEFVWYKAKIPNYLKEITLSARHLFSVYINGKEVLNRNSYKYEKLQQIEETISIKLNEAILNKEENELTILVQNLGFDKGFSGETNNPRGLIAFKTSPEHTPTFYVNEGLFHSEAESESPYLVKLSTTFDYQKEENVIKSMFLSMKNFPYDRSTIFLNGMKIGRYLKTAQNKSLQDDFYLLEPFLKTQNTLDIVIWEKDTKIKTPWGFKNELKRGIISVGDKEVHQLY